MAHAPVATQTAPRSRSEAFNALKYPNYRSYWFGLMAVVTGYQVLFVAQGWLVYDLTGSPALLGAMGAATAIPQIFLTPLAGVMADRVDRRRLMVVTQLGYGVIMMTLAVLLLTGVVGKANVELSVALLLVASFVASVVQTFDQPARMALVPQLLGSRDDLLNAIALQNLVWQGTSIVGPAIGGLLIAGFGVAACYVITSLSVLGMVTGLLRMQLAPAPSSARNQSIAHNMSEGVEFIRGNAVIASLLAMIFFNCFFGLSYMSLVPAFAKDVLQVGAEGQGFMMAAFGAGAILGSIIIATWGRVLRTGVLVVVGSFGFGLALFGYALSDNYWLTLALLMLLGVLRTMWMTSGSASIQGLVPNELRGRVMGIYGLAWALVPLGGLASGTVAALISPPFAVAVGGAAVAAFSIVLALRASHLRSLH